MHGVTFVGSTDQVNEGIHGHPKFYWQEFPDLQSRDVVRVSITRLVLPSITDTVFDIKFVTYTLPFLKSYAIPIGPLPTGIVLVTESALAIPTNGKDVNNNEKTNAMIIALADKDISRLTVFLYCLVDIILFLS